MKDNTRLVTTGVIMVIVLAISLVAAITYKDLKNCGDNQACKEAVRG